MYRGLATASLICAMTLGLVCMTGCDTAAQSGAGIGALGGAGVGALIGHASGNTGMGALIGGAAGAGGGYLIGNEMDKKKTSNEMQSIREEANTVVVNVTNSNGSMTPVILRRAGNIYVGPKGEQYTTLPAAEQLKPIYGI